MIIAIINLYWHNTKLLSTLSNLQTNLFRIDLTKHGPTYGKIVNAQPQTPQGESATKPETPLQKKIQLKIIKG